jgi:hypothetical protein
LKIKSHIGLSALILCFIMLFSYNGFSSLVPAYGQGQNISITSFQSKVSIIDNMPSQKVTVGDIEIAYKQLGESGAKPIILVTGLGATMDTWSPLLLEQLTSSNYSVTIFDNRGQESLLQGQRNFQSVSLQMIQRVCSKL